MIDLWTPPSGIINDGLVLYLDAGIKGSYPGSGTTWTDLAGSNDGTLTNGPTYSSANGGSIVFDGTDDYATISTAGTGMNDFGTGDFTIESWAMPSGPTFGRLLDCRPSGDNGLDHWYCDLNSSIFLFSNTSTSVSGNHGLASTDWGHLVCTRNSGTIKLYVNNAEVASQTFSQSFSAALNRPVIASGGYIFGGAPTDCKVAIVRIYKKGFSATEITQNFEATRGRFGV